MGLVEFLNARLDEDEQAARDAADPPPPAPVNRYILIATWGGGSNSWIGQDWPWNPKRALAEVEAKRRTLGFCAAILAQAPQLEFHEAPDLADDVLTELLQPYSDHPDFDPDWKVSP